MSIIKLNYSLKYVCYKIILWSFTKLNYSLKYIVTKLNYDNNYIWNY